MGILSNKQCKYLLDLFIIFVMGCVFGLLALCFLMVSGKHPPRVYLIGVYIIGGITIGLLICIRILVDAIEVSDDLDKKIRIEELKIQYKQLPKGE
jgi:hypothetical protein